jgi:hypothetical protein
MLQILPCPPCQLGPLKVGTIVVDDGTQMTLHPSVLGLSLPFALSPPMKAIAFQFWQNFWTNPSTISPFHATNKF